MLLVEPVALTADPEAVADPLAEMLTCVMGPVLSVKAQLASLQRHELATGSKKAVWQSVGRWLRTPSVAFWAGTGSSGVGWATGHP